MDPQQGLALELCWEGFEDAGIVVDRLTPLSVGVFLGVMANDFADLMGTVPDEQISPYLHTGMGRSLIANRVSRALSLSGPSLTVDTGQSSSLVAVHLACESLRRRECGVALAGGVNLILSRHHSLRTAKFDALSPDGRCYVFDSRANGYVRGEGGGVVVLKSLADAVHSGDRIYGVIRGSAINAGSAHAGITVPSESAQADVITRALANAGLGPEEIGYVELHGTGTAVGDPVEAGALGAVYGNARGRGAALGVGSIKTNIGHLEGAAGIAGLIKAALCVQRQELVASLNFSKANPRIPLDELRLRVVTKHERWPAGSGSLSVGVSSFGMGGSNCHVIVCPPSRSPEADVVSAQVTAAPVVAEAGLALAWVVSAKTETGLKAQAARLGSYVADHPGLGAADVGLSLATTRAGLEHRAVVVGADRGELLAGLAGLAAGSPTPGVVTGRVADGKTAFVFPGQGGQWPAMAVQLWDFSPVFAAQMRACGQALAPHVGWSLEEVLRGGDESWLTRVDVVQPALFAVMVSLAALWRACGVTPDMVMGHSQGEIAAAYVAGGLSLEDAAKVVALRSQAIAELAGSGGMAAIGLPAAQVDQRLTQYGQRVSVAALNSPASTVVCGEPAALDELVAACAAQGVFARRIPVDYASHSAQVEVVEQRLVAQLSGISPRSGTVPFYSTVTGEQLSTEALDGRYWYANLRQPVQFERATRGLIEQGCRALIEMGPHPVLAVAMAETVEASSAGAVAVLGSLRRDEGGWPRFVTSLAEANVAGVSVNWATIFALHHPTRVRLPTYAFQRQRYWLSGRSVGDVASVGLSGVGHPFLAGGVCLGGERGWLFSGSLSVQTHRWLADYAVADVVLVPGSAFVELVLAAGARAGVPRVEELVIEAPLLLPEQGAVALQLLIGGPDAEGRCGFEVYSRPEHSVGLAGDGDVGVGWVHHVSGVLVAGVDGGELEEWSSVWPPPGAVAVAGSLYDQPGGVGGFHYGPAFQAVRAVWRRGEELFVEVGLDADLIGEAAGFGVHPALLNAAWHVAPDLWGDQSASGGLPVSFAWGGVSLRRGVFRRCGWRSVRLRAGGCGYGRWMRFGAPVVSVESVQFRRVDAVALGRVGARRLDWLHEVDWVAVQSPPEGVVPGVAVLDRGGPMELAGEGVRCYPDLGALIAVVGAGGSAPEVVLTAVPIAAAGVGEVRGGLYDTLELIQAWLGEPVLGGSRLVVVTQAAVAAVEGEVPDLAGALVEGLLRSAASEHPGRFMLLDLDGSAASWAAVPAAVAQRGEPRLAVRDGVVLAPRLVQVSEQVGDPVAGSVFDPAAAVLITGGTGVLGMALARHVAARYGVGHVVLVSRGGAAAAGVEQLVAELGELGCGVQVVACDVGDREQLAGLVDSVCGEHRLGAVIHVAGVLADGVIESLDRARVEQVLAPKVDGAWHLHELTREMGLSAFVLFSSAAAVLGSAGQANYVAGNAFLDALACYRRGQGLAGVSLGWGLWEQASAMAGEMQRMGLAGMSTEQGLELFDLACARGEPVLVPARLDVAALRRQARLGLLPAVLSGLVSLPVAAASAGGSLAQRLARAAEADWDAVLLAELRGQLAAVLGHSSPEAVAAERAFSDLGLDSRGAVELRNRLAQATGLTLPATVIFDHPNLAAVAGYLRARLQGGATGVVVRARVRADEPIAVVGMGCRLPGGVDGPQGLWEVVVGGRDVISGFPTDRGWDVEGLYDPDPDRVGASYTRMGGFVEGVADFDAGFFGISPREALAMDPQQRLLLETAWETFESAGIDPRSVRGSDIGVFAGAYSSQYGGGGGAEVEGYLLTGTEASVVSGRIAYVFGLGGPAVTVDTACSSSLVAVHQACAALRAGECSLALAGGVTVMATPRIFVEFSRQRGLSVDGRCKSFAAGADGTGFAEGAGLVLVERLSDARRNGHEVLAVIRGSAVNQDGASNGLTAPNGPSQERVIAAALASAGLGPAEVDVVEAHGTGTVLGDPIEAQAIIATYGQGRDPDRPLWLGSVKSNIGHTQAAAGVAGVIKMIQALRHEVLPQTLHVDEPSAHVDWSAGAVSLLTQAQPWPHNGRVRRAAVSSFGISGTNAHLILEQAPASELPADGEVQSVPVDVSDSVLAWVISAKTETGLKAQAARLGSYLADHPGLGAADVGFSLATGRAGLEHRAVVVGADRGELLAGLAGLAAGSPTPGVVTGRVADGKTAFVFAGQGGQWPAMAVQLWDFSPVFAAQMRACGQALAPHVGWSLEEVLRGGDESWLTRVDVVQPALFAVMVSLAALWRACGVTPDMVMGHSQGEIAAAYVAGGLSLEDAAKVVALRSQAIAELAGSGGMAAIGLPAAQVDQRLTQYGQRVSVAAINSPASTVVCGDPAALDELVAACAAQGVFARRIPVDYASHSAQVEVVEQRLVAQLSGISPRAGTVPFYSTVTGEQLSTEALDGRYWYANLRQPVQFERATRGLIEQGCRALIEMGPHPVLAVAMTETAEASNAGAVAVLGSLRRDEGGWPRFVTSLAEAHVAGVTVNWATIFAPHHPKRVELPTYAFEHQRYWLTGTPAGSGDVSGSGLDRAEHALLGAVLAQADSGGVVLTGQLSLSAQPWLADHAVGGVVLFPGTGFVELAIRAGDEVGCGVIEELTLAAPLVLPTQGQVRVQVVVGGVGESGGRPVSVYSLGGEADSQWVRHAAGMLGAGHAGSSADLSVWPPVGALSVDISDAYARLAERGYEYGRAFRGLRSMWRRGQEVFVEVGVPEDAGVDLGGFGLHPVLFDAALHAVALAADTGTAQTLLPFSWRAVSLHARGASWVRARIAPVDADSDGGGGFSVELADITGGPVLSVGLLTARPISAEQLRSAASAAGRGGSGRLFELDWVTAPVPTEPPAAVSVLSWDGFEQSAMPADAPDAPDVVVWELPISPGAVVAGVYAATHAALERLQSWLARDRAAVLVVLTHGAVGLAGEDVTDLAGAAVWGLVRAAQAEQPGRIVLVDTDAPVDVAVLVGLGEPQLLVRSGGVYLARLAPAPPLLRVPPGETTWRLAVGGGGTFEDVVVQPCPQAHAPLGAGQVRVAVRAVGVTFRDVLAVSGMYLGQAPVLGCEGAGVVVEIGPDVAGVAVGDAVLGLIEGVGPLAVVDQRLVFRVPSGWSFVQAAGVPVAFLTAWFVLADLAALSAGESVLVHAATEGVGMAAVQLARLRGATIFVTAGRGKWDTLRAMGFDEEHIADSRTLEFEQKFLAVTGGRGVDVVLNALAGEFLDASLRLLADGGRFIEMGKTDIRDPQTIAKTHPGVWYRAFDLAEAGPERIAAILVELGGLFEARTLHRLPVKAWDVRCAAAAYRYVSRACHVGKVVLTMPGVFADALAAGTVLITGGTGMAGAVLARHVVAAYGVRHLLLVSRRGMAAEGAGELVAELTRAGAQVQVVACDVADRAAVAGLLDRLAGQCPPLTGVIHAAGTLDDALIGSLTPDRVDAVLRAKVDAAWNLHEVTCDMGLPMFALCSSIAGVVGTAGQGNYAAANAFLDGLAAHRHAAGLAGVSLAWGLWEQASAMTGHLTDRDRARMSRGGVAAMTAEQAVEMFDTALTLDRPTVVAARIDHAALVNRAQNAELAPLFGGLIRRPLRRQVKGAGSGPGLMGGRLAGLNDTEQLRVVRELILQCTADVLGWARDDRAKSTFENSGLDSLNAMEIRNLLNSATGLKLSQTVIFDYKTPDLLARHIVDRINERRKNISTVDSRSSGSITEESRSILIQDSLEALFKDAVDAGKMSEGMHLLRAASRLRPVFGPECDADILPTATRFTAGPRLPHLVFICTSVFTSGVYVYARIASAFESVRPVSAVPLCGFSAGEPLPSSPEAAVKSLARVVMELVGDEPFVLAGYSSGGHLAYALGDYFEHTENVSVAGVALLDTYSIEDGELLLSTSNDLFYTMYERTRDWGLYNGTRLTAMAGWSELMPSLYKGPLEADVLFVQCTRPYLKVRSESGSLEYAIATPWAPKQTVRTVPAHHESVVFEGAELVAQILEEWITSLEISR